MTATWLADVLRAAGLSVVEHPGWKTRGEGAFTNLRAVVWHHDASPVGYSPGMADYEVREVDAHKPGANCWVTLDGTWHLIAAEVTYHAGKVLPGKPGNHEAIGVETDHTTGETWSGVDLLDSLRRGTAAILAHLDQLEGGLHFHKTICSPVGRKSDPDGLELAIERAAIHGLMEDDMPLTDKDIDRIADKVHERLAGAPLIDGSRLTLAKCLDFLQGDPFFGERFNLNKLAVWCKKVAEDAVAAALKKAS